MTGEGIYRLTGRQAGKLSEALTRAHMRISHTCNIQNINKLAGNEQE